jgi:hypothetical protein
MPPSVASITEENTSLSQGVSASNRLVENDGIHRRLFPDKSRTSCIQRTSRGRNAQDRQQSQDPCKLDGLAYVSKTGGVQSPKKPTTTTTLITRDHFLRFANLILLVISATKPTIWLPAYSPFLFLWPGGEYGLADRGKVVWWWRLSKGITLGTLRVLANMVGSISGNGQRKDGLKSE